MWVAQQDYEEEDDGAEDDDEEYDEEDDEDEEEYEQRACASPQPQFPDLPVCRLNLCSPAPLMACTIATVPTLLLVIPSTADMVVAFLCCSGQAAEAGSDARRRGR